MVGGVNVVGTHALDAPPPREQVFIRLQLHVGACDLTSCVELLLGVAWSCVDLCGVRWSCVDLCGVRWSYVELYRVLWNKVEVICSPIKHFHGNILRRPYSR